MILLIFMQYMNYRPIAILYVADRPETHETSQTTFTVWPDEKLREVFANKRLRQRRKWSAARLRG